MLASIWVPEEGAQIILRYLLFLGTLSLLSPDRWVLPGFVGSCFIGRHDIQNVSFATQNTSLSTS